MSKSSDELTAAVAAAVPFAEAVRAESPSFDSGRAESRNEAIQPATQTQQAMRFSLLSMCRAFHVYAARETPQGRRGRIVIAEEPDPTLIKLTITEPERNGDGYKSVSIQLTTEGFAGLRYAIGQLPAPLQGSQAPELRDQIQSLGATNEKLREDVFQLRKKLRDITAGGSDAKEETDGGVSINQSSPAPSSGDYGSAAYVINPSPIGERTMLVSRRGYADDDGLDGESPGS
jgi:hypothetical protein